MSFLSLCWILLQQLFCFPGEFFFLINFNFLFCVIFSFFFLWIFLVVFWCLMFCNSCSTISYVGYLTFGRDLRESFDGGINFTCSLKNSQFIFLRMSPCHWKMFKPGLVRLFILQVRTLFACVFCCPPTKHVNCWRCNKK